MVKHIVMFKFLPSAEGRSKDENVRLTAEKLKALQGKIPELISSEVIIGAEAQAESNYDLILIADYKNFDDLNAYIVHPLHKAVGEFMKNLRESRACIDYEY